MKPSFEITPARGQKLPVIISCPHVGTLIPDDIKTTMIDGIADKTADTDWYVHELYNFAPAMGITLIKANYSRYVIDLNRDPTGKSLYSDQRRQTALVPMSTFAGEAIYKSGNLASDEIARRRHLYFDPYHAAVDAELAALKRTFNHVLFFDAHSIKRHVPSIRSEEFPDMILGDNLGKSADPVLSNTALTTLRSNSTFSVAHNDPFMGGYLTRSKGAPADGLHALQLEMSQDLYMNESDNSRNPEKQKQVAGLLEKLFYQLNIALEGLVK